MSHVTALGHLIHELANKAALESVQESAQWDRNRGTKPDGDTAVKRYNSAYRFHTNKLLYFYDQITREEYEALRVESC